MGEYMELYYVYAVICRKIFLYDYLPDQLNEDLEPIEFISSDFRLNAVLPKHLQATDDEINSESAEKFSFITQYFSYAQLLAIALWQALEEIYATLE